jgi:RNA polymerase sigma factor (sigma-70 family)
LRAWSLRWLIGPVTREQARASDGGRCEAHRSIEAIWRIESARVVGALARVTRDVGVAEDLAQDALVAALEQWPRDGIPDRPGAWLTAVGKRRAIDLFRRQENLARREEELGRSLETAEPSSQAEFAAVEEDIEDDLLRLVFTTCHPVLGPDARVALTLKVLGGLTTAEIARAYLTSEATIAQRIVRAKKTLARKGIGFDVPAPAQMPERLASVLEVVYLIFNEGYAASAGEDWLRPELCADALRLGRVLASLMPREAEVHGLVALMELQASRSRARVASDGSAILLLDQDRARWDHAAIRRGLASLERAEALASERGPYAVQAAIAACHARAGTAEDTDWGRIAALYGVLVRQTNSPVVELNRAVAVSMAQGPAAGLGVLDPLMEEPALSDYHLLWSARADMLERLGRVVAARAAFERAAALTRNARERDVLLARAAQASPTRAVTVRHAPTTHAG